MRKNEESQTIGSLPRVVDRQDEKTPMPLIGSDATVLPQQLPADNSATTLDTPYDDMRRSIRTWGWWLVGWTIFSALDLNIPWATVLAIVGFMSFYFYDTSAMFLVYAGTLLWAAVWNLLVGGDSVWVFVGLIQVLSTVFAYREYRKYRNAKANHEVELLSQAPSVSSFSSRESHMAWLSLLLGAIGLVGLCSLIPVSLVLYSQAPDDPAYPIYSALAMTWELGALGISVGIAASFTGRGPKAAAAVGIALGVLSALMLIIGISMAAGA